ncbi:MAG TPA: hypothetical protein VFA94_04320 [Acidimicrobiales bacterium]|nr:hypothetical protein [Acidimicrobiales bacterium]
MKAWVSPGRALRFRPSSSVSLGDDDRRQVERRRAAATRLVGPSSGPAERVAGAPPAYLMAHGSSDIARQCELLTPVPSPRQVRVVATPGRSPGEWHLDVASRDRPGLLAACSGVLSAWGLDVVQAVLATWADGAALEAFVVRSPLAPDPSVLQPALEASLDQPPWSPPVTDARVTFDDRASALYTSCDVRAADRPTLLHAVAVAIATAGADVHAARVTTTAGVAHDRFDLSDRYGKKLDAALRASIRTRITDGVPAARRGR